MTLIQPTIDRITDRLDFQIWQYQMQHDGRDPSVLLLEPWEIYALSGFVHDAGIFNTYCGIRLSTAQREYDPLRHWGILPRGAQP